MFSSSAASSTETLAAWLNPYAAIWHVDFEFREDVNHHPVPVCMFAYEQRTVTEIQMWRDELLSRRHAPFDVGPQSLFVA